MGHTRASTWLSCSAPETASRYRRRFPPGIPPRIPPASPPRIPTPNPPPASRASCARWTTSSHGFESWFRVMASSHGHQGRGQPRSAAVRQRSSGIFPCLDVGPQSCRPVAADITSLLGGGGSRCSRRLWPVDRRLLGGAVVHSCRGPQLRCRDRSGAFRLGHFPPRDFCSLREFQARPSGAAAGSATRCRDECARCEIAGKAVGLVGSLSSGTGRPRRGSRQRSASARARAGYAVAGARTPSDLGYVPA
jgi:hypothetical protein